MLTKEQIGAPVNEFTSQSANTRQWKQFPMTDPRSHQRKGGISIAPRDVDSTAKSDRIRKAGI